MSVNFSIIFYIFITNIFINNEALIEIAQLSVLRIQVLTSND